MIWGALRVLNGIPKMGQPRNTIKPTPVHKPVAVAIVIMSAIVIGITVAAGTVAGSAGLLTACIVGFSLLILGSLFVRGVQESLGKQRKLSILPPIPPPPTADQMRERADVLDKLEVVPEPRVIREAKSYGQMVAERELDERMMRCAAILIAPCPACNAGEAEFCTFTEGEYITVMDAERGLIAHNKRVGNAIKLHTAKVTDVVAQFNNHVPEDVWEAAL